MYSKQIARYKGKSANNKMGNVVLSPNIRKTSVRINPNGDVIDAKTKQVIEPNVVETVSPEDMKPKVKVEPEEISTPKTSKIDEMISKKIEEIINRKITEALENL